MSPNHVDRLLSAVLLALWFALSAVAVHVLPPVEVGAPWVGLTLTWMLGVVIGTVWMVSLRSLAVLVLYPLLARRRHEVPAYESDAGVVLLSCAADDFNPRALRASMNQTHPRVSTVILDDSKDERVRAEIDSFAARTGARVVRRARRTGFKAGNLNDFLLRGIDEEYVVVVDSDEVLPPDFVRRALDHAVHRARSGVRVGVVQGRHRTLRRVSGFADEFGALLETHVRVTQLVRSRFGFSHFMGRGALISTECLRATRGFPEVVAEDLAFSIEATAQGFEIVYAPELVSTEEFPIDYFAFKKQHGKAAEGSVEIVRQYLAPVLRSSLRPWQKADLLLEVLSAPLGAALSALLLVFSAIASSSGEDVLPSWAGAAIGLGGLLPLLPEALRRLSRGEVRSAAVFLLRALVLYASVLWTTAAAVWRVVGGGGARFTITPKTRNTSQSASFRNDVVAALVLSGLSVVVCGSALPALGFLVAAGCAVYLGARSGAWAIPGPQRASVAAPTAHGVSSKLGGWSTWR
ncbi:MULTISPECIES: glycosyltransferase [unclassified Rathayibacter]|uniref:glycosyltransferase n=1 Tax=unclassified Rathayibacter TaxID=2609250 RepID=UPI00188B40D2|nr:MULTISPECIES: glycosyltransferase [unclassified Rathayibacter]MBF4463289.1 glycosyltransferase [Rathayibacter sp. VKM Ac-2879]MBF4504474.1 glycosyltransferase [Rathayibacter sp. VKM Ac-2878]